MEASLFGSSWSPPVAALILTAGAVLVATVLYHVVYAILCRVLDPGSTAGTFVRRLNAPLRLAAPLVGLAAVLPGLPIDPDRYVPVTHATVLAIILTLTWAAVRFVQAGGEAVERLNPATTDDNLHAREVRTRSRVLARVVEGLLVVVGVSIALMTFPDVRAFGSGLLASAGLAGLIAGFAARPVLSNLIAGLQIALTQPIRIDDVVIVENEWGRIEEITGTYVVVKIWDERRLVVPLQWLIEHPFQNWTRTSSELLGTVFLWLDYRTPLDLLRAEVARVCKADPDWDGRSCTVIVTDSNERAMQVRALVSAADSSRLWDLRCRVREALIALVQARHADYLPRLRAEIATGEEAGTLPA
jgi:small-conductance mechanosensitive channel